MKGREKPDFREGRRAKNRWEKEGKGFAKAPWWDPRTQTVKVENKD